jgi:polar amino acid transport system substrate-binding protein
MSKFLAALLLLILFTPAAISCDEKVAKAFLANVHWQAEDYPPYNYLDNSGHLVGIFSDILVLIYKDLGIDIKINDIPVVPWARVLKNIGRYPDHAAFSMVTTREREKQYKLVALPFITKISIMALSSRFNNGKKVEKASLNKLHIGVVRGDIGQSLLNSHKILAVQVKTISAISMLKMLLHERVDAIAYSEDVASFQFDKFDHRKDKIIPIYSLDETSFTNFVFHKSTSSCVTSLFEKTITTLNEEGQLTPVWEKYLKNY